MFRLAKLISDNMKMKKELLETVKQLLKYSQYEGIEKIRTRIRETLKKVED